MMNGIRYLWQDKEKSFDNGNYQNRDNREVSVINYHNRNKTEDSYYDNFLHGKIKETLLSMIKVEYNNLMLRNNIRLEILQKC